MKKKGEFRVCSIKLTEINHRGLKILSARTGKSLITLSNEAVTLYLKQHKDKTKEGE